MSFEGFGQMTVVCETSREGDLTERDFGCGNLPARKLHTQTTQVFADRATMLLAKDAGQVNRMHAHCFRDLRKSERFREIVVQKLFRLCEPARSFPLRRGGLTA